jgi:glucose-6-phosphate-specific signal transduction histidine kinase
MAGMHERVSTLGGQMKVVSRKGEGTKISVTVPLPPRQEEVEAKAKTKRVLISTGS